MKLVALFSFLFLLSCGSPASNIVILFENDVHGMLSGYSKFFSIAEQEKSETPYVTKVSCGDFIQGNVVASVTEGQAIIDIMNRVGYDVVTIGNHEFDYGLPRLFQLVDSLHSSVVCANFRYLPTDSLCFLPYTIIEYGDVNIAYIGVTTTTTLINTAPQTFRDERGNLLYDFMLNDFYESIQKSINSARSNGADYVIILSHLGEQPYAEHPTSVDLIKGTKGVNVVLDGHSHSVIPDSMVVNSVGDSVLLVSTGTKFQNIGRVVLLPNGTFSSKLIPIDSPVLVSDSFVQGFVDSLVQNRVASGERIVGHSMLVMPYTNADGDKLSYMHETLIGDFCADAFKVVLNSDVAVINGGGIREGIELGKVSFNDLYSIFPFNNVACVAKMSGQELLNALEVAVSWLPNADGSFIQVSGMRFNVDVNVPSPVIFNLSGVFSCVGNGKRRVSNLQIYDRDEGVYKDVDLFHEYTIASYDYLLKDLGSAGMFKHANIVRDNLGLDVEILLCYIEKVLQGVIPASYEDEQGRIIFKDRN